MYIYTQKQNHKIKKVFEEAQQQLTYVKKQISNVRNSFNNDHKYKTQRKTQTIFKTTKTKYKTPKTI